jgi:hypothetical protein
VVCLDFGVWSGIVWILDMCEAVRVLSKSILVGAVEKLVLNFSAASGYSILGSAKANKRCQLTKN